MSSFTGEEYQVVKRGREYYGCGKENRVEKRERGSNIILRLLGRMGRISSGEEAKEFFFKKINIQKRWVGKNIKL